MRKFITIHGHFYQPPRENPWTGEVDLEPSAAPFHDWNERINKECYEANTQASLMNGRGEVVAHSNNFSDISFDIGPTLLSWLKRKDPTTYNNILAADRESVRAHGGHGNAIAQIYNHIIMPLASTRDKITQIAWGIRDFEFHFQRKPEGMWLSEAAVDRETLNLLADQGILFTILAPHQARRVRHVGFGSRWAHPHHEGIDTKHPYRILLDRGRQFHLFFYHGQLSREIAFNGALSNGENFAHKLINAFGGRDREQLVSTATDGESYGHHHRFGEMALAYAIKKISEDSQVRMTNYGEFLDRFGSFWEADIVENSSWSCAHGVERWRSDCGCRMNFQGGWNQRWRAILRDAFDFLKEAVDEVFEKELAPILKDPWVARNQYIDVILDPSVASRNHFLAKNVSKKISLLEENKIWDLMEAEKFSLFMYTSCGWFFDELSGIEPVQMMKFASRAMELAQPYRKENMEAAFLGILEHAQSNIAEMGTGKDIFNKFVKTEKPEGK